MTHSSVSTDQNLLSGFLRGAILVTTVINVLVGLAFLLGPELGLMLWPTPIAPILMRFIGSIVFANGIGAAMIAQRGTWEGARVLFMVALIYGVIILVALLYHLLFLAAPALFWIYVGLDAIFLGPIVTIFWVYDRNHRRI
ncbi:MAG TPA: hypothetical protein VGD99_27150 [Anaerolineae bacterium]